MNFRWNSAMFICYKISIYENVDYLNVENKNIEISICMCAIIM